MRSESSALMAKATELVQAGRKDRALLVLKMRRLREEESQKAEASLLNVEKLVRHKKKHGVLGIGWFYMWGEGVCGMYGT